MPVSPSQRLRKKPGQTTGAGFQAAYVRKILMQGAKDQAEAGKDSGSTVPAIRTEAVRTAGPPGQTGTSPAP